MEWPSRTSFRPHFNTLVHIHVWLCCYKSDYQWEDFRDAVFRGNKEVWGSPKYSMHQSQSVRTRPSKSSIYTPYEVDAWIGGIYFFSSTKFLEIFQNSFHYIPVWVSLALWHAGQLPFGIKKTNIHLRWLSVKLREIPAELKKPKNNERRLTRSRSEFPIQGFVVTSPQHVVKW